MERRAKARFGVRNACCHLQRNGQGPIVHSDATRPSVVAQRERAVAAGYRHKVCVSLGLEQTNGRAQVALCARNVQRIHGQPTTGSVPRIVCRVRPPPRPTRSPRSLDVVHTFKTSSASGFGDAGHLQPRLPLQRSLRP